MEARGRPGWGRRLWWWTWALALLVGAAGCGSEEPAEEGGGEGVEEVGEASGASPNASAPASEVITATPTVGTPSVSAMASTSPTPQETAQERLRRIARGPVRSDVGFQVTVLSLSLEPMPYKSAVTGKKEVGIGMRATGVVFNRTGRTLSEGALTGALVLGFGESVARVRLSPDGFKQVVVPEDPWRDGESRLFSIDTEPFPQLLLEYEPTAVDATLVASFRDPVDFEVAAPIWRARVSWLSARVAPVRGEAQVFQADPLVAGPRGRSPGKLKSGEVVKLLYQSGGWFRVTGEEGTGWVGSRALVVKNISEIYVGATPSGGPRVAMGGDASLTVHSVKTVEEVPRTVKLGPGERVVLAEVELANQGEKELKCSDVFMDFGPTLYRGAMKETPHFEGALVCARDRLGPGESVKGTLAFLRGRHDLPVAVGWVARDATLLVDVYSTAEASPWRR